MIGIYQIVNKINNKIYVGKTTRDIKTRWNEHLCDLRNGRSSPHLQNAWDKYGEESFNFFILEECIIKELKEKEEYWINKLESWKKEKGYNIERYSQEEIIVSEETRKKLSDINKGKKISEETKQKISESTKGEKNHFYKKQHSVESKKIIGEKSKGRNIGEKSINAKLTWEQVKEIREKYKTKKYNVCQLAKEYKVVRTTIETIILNKTWIDSDYFPPLELIRFAPKFNYKNHKNVKLNWDIVEKIRKEYEINKKTVTDIAKEYNFNRITLYKVVKYKTWKKTEN